MKYTKKDFTKAHKDKTKEQQIDKKEVTTTYFTISSFSYPQGANLEGYPIILKRTITPDDETRIYAKLSQHGNYITRWIKIDKKGRLYNPFDIYHLAQEKRERRSSKPNWTFRKVSENVFLSYINYLKTRNESYLRNAERERV